MSEFWLVVVSLIVPWGWGYAVYWLLEKVWPAPPPLAEEPGEPAPPPSAPTWRPSDYQI